MGETLWASMMQGHASRLKWHHSVHSSDEDETKENSTPTASSVKLSQSSAHPNWAAEGLDLMVGIMECQRDVQEQLLEEHIQANENNHLAHEAHEHTMSALLAIMYEFATVVYYFIINGKMNNAKSNKKKKFIVPI